MISLLIINTKDNILNDWLNALRDSGLAVHEDHMRDEEGCSQLRAKTNYDLIIYHSDESSSDDDFFECLSQSENMTPVIISSESPTTELFKKYAPAGVKDIFQSQDYVRLVLIATREIEAYQFSRQLHDLKQQFSESEHRYQNLLDTSEDAIAYIQDGMHMHANPAYMAMFNYDDEDEILLKPVTEMVAETYQENFKTFLKTIKQLTAEQKIEVKCNRANDEPFMALLTFSPAVYEGEDCVQIQVENRELQYKFRQVSGQDPQTGLYSRQQFTQDLEALLTRKDPQAGGISLLYIMVDGFEEMKNTHGLMTSDLILQEISGLLQGLLSTEMTLYRFGDHSFTLLLQSDDLQQAKYLAERFIRHINNHTYTSVPDVIPPTLSIGLTNTNPSENDDNQQLPNSALTHAYQACREIYTTAGNGFLAYENLARQLPDENEIAAIDDTIHLKELLDYALEHDRFQLVYQPIVSIQGDTSENYAVLLRLLNSDNEEIRPRHFIKQAVQYGLMTDIDRWVIKHAINAIASYRRDNNRLNFFIQISENGIQDETLLLWIVDCLREANAKGSWLTFQFNLPDLSDHLLAAEKLINGLKKINCFIAINHFEHGEQPRQLLDKIPFDVIKLHHSAISDIETNHELRRHLVELNKVSHEKRIKTVATKIEDGDVLSVLWHTGINYIQGFVLQEPAATINYEQS